MCMHQTFAQKKTASAKYPFSQLTIEPAIGTRITTFLGNADVQLANLVQYNITRRFSVAAHTNFSFDIPANQFSDVKQNYSYTINQKFGIGTSFHGKRTTNAFFILAGLKYNAYSGTLKNTDFIDQITTQTSSLTSDYGMMYHIKSGRKKYFFSGRLYLPLKDGTNGIIENANIELGVGIRIR
jgi:hypothetical protein